MKASIQGTSLLLEFDSSELAQVQQCLLALSQNGIPVMQSQSTNTHVVLTEERLAQVETRRVRESLQKANEGEIQARLSAGLLPFKAQQTPPKVPMRNSPRQTAKQFAGESPSQNPTPMPLRKQSESLLTLGSGSTKTGRNLRRVPTSSTSAT